MQQPTDNPILQRILMGGLGMPGMQGGQEIDPDIRRQMLMATAGNLLAGSGYSPVPQTFGSIAGQALLAGQQAKTQGIRDNLQNLLLQRQLEKPQQPLIKAGPGDVFFDPNKPGSNPVYSVPAKPERPQDPLAQLNADFAGGGMSPADYQERKKLLLTRQSPVSVTLNTGKQLGETMAAEVGKQYATQYDAAQTATESIASSNRVRDLLKVTPYTGAGADWKLSFGKAAKAVGFDYAGDDIQNTELLAKELGQNVLNNVKSSGLAGSQGLTEGERKFLLQVVGGTINLDDKSLARIADLNERVARNSIKKWNAVTKRLPKETLDQLGMGPIEEDSSGNGLGNGWSIRPVQ